LILKTRFCQPFALPFFLIYILADTRSILGGYLSGAFIKK